MTNILLCGGSGTRLWPLSRELMPKQFLRLFESQSVINQCFDSQNLKNQGFNSSNLKLNPKNSKFNSKNSSPKNLNKNDKFSPQNHNFSDKSTAKSLFQLCIERNSSLCEKILIVSNEEQYFLALDQLLELENPLNFSFLLEPLARNTAAAITLAALSLEKSEICLVSPSDQLIRDLENYHKIIREAENLAANNAIITLGIKPTHAHTGFGYIKTSANGDVLGFYEKPNLKTAQGYLKEGNFFWNSGIFVFRVEFFLKEMKKFAPEILKACENAIKNAKFEPNLARISREKMAAIPENSIDYALMEHSKSLKLIPANIKWSDVGSFDALYDELGKDEHKNAILANALNLGSSGNLIYSQDKKKLIATADIKNLIVIDTPDALLLCPRAKAQRVKELVGALQDENIRKIHTTAHRPWGSYTVLENERGYKIKRIEVKPGKKLSLQKHLHRSEHWVVLSGTASVIVGDEKRLVRPNESTYIKVGQIHRLANEGKIPVVLIEAQVGEYTEEDDIIRLEDEFKRV